MRNTQGTVGPHPSLKPVPKTSQQAWVSRRPLPGGQESVAREPKLPIFDFKLTISLWDLGVRGSVYRVLDSGLSIADVQMAGGEWALVAAPSGWN